MTKPTRKIKVLIYLPPALKAYLDAKRREGYTISGFIEAMLTRVKKDDHAQ